MIIKKHDCNAKMYFHSFKVEDLIYIQNCNLLDLPENYQMKYCKFMFYFFFLQVCLYKKQIFIMLYLGLNYLLLLKTKMEKLLDTC